MWACLGALEVGDLNYNINGSSIQKDGPLSLHNFMVDGFLINLIYLEPLNLFLYTWWFLPVLEESVSKPTTKTFLKWFAHTSILLIPSANVSLVVAYIIENARYGYYLFHSKIEEARYYYNIEHKLFKAVAILGPLSNLISCLIITMVILLVV